MDNRHTQMYMYRLCIYNKQKGTDIERAIQTELDKIHHRQIFAH